jgi:hypothetical protein
MPELRKIVSNEYFLVFMLCMAVLAGPAITALFQYNLTRFPDCASYMGLAHFDFAQNPARRYRILIPFAATGINFILGSIFSRMSPSYFAGDFSLQLCFFLINLCLTSFFGLLIYRYCRAFGADRASAAVGMLAMLTCRYTVYMVAYPLVDSLFCVVIALSLLGLKTKNTGMLLWAIFLGPFAKESFIFIAPIIFFFSHLGKAKLLLFFLISGILVFAFRYILDVYTMASVKNALQFDVSHFGNLTGNLSKLFSFSTLFKVIMNIGLWLLIPLAALSVDPRETLASFKKMDKYLAWFMASVVIQMLLSGSMERMFYLAMPVICVVVALSFRELRKLTPETI